MRGHTCCRGVGDTMILRLGNDGAGIALMERHTRPVDFSGRPRKSIVRVGLAALAEDTDPAHWLDRAIAFVATLPPN